MTILEMINDRKIPLTTIVKEVFKMGGAMDKAGLKLRQSQFEMALKIAEAIEKNQWSGIEAPCGTGKTFAYLVPGIIAARRKKKAPKETNAMVVSTGNIALQAQLRDKDIPALSKILGFEIKSVVYKGRSNYLCFQELSQNNYFFHGTSNLLHQELERLRLWGSQPGCTGDKDDLPFQVSYAAWEQASTDSDGCIKEKCPHYDVADGNAIYPRCLSEKARDGRDDADIIIVNHHFLAVSPFISLHPPLLVMDEAHQFASAVRSMQSIEIRRGTFQAAANRVKNFEAYSASEIRNAMDYFFRIVDAKGRSTTAPKLRLRPGWWDAADTDFVLKPVQRAIRMLEQVKPKDDIDKKKGEGVIETLQKLEAALKRMFEAKPEAGKVYWIERTGQQFAINYANVDIEPWVKHLKAKSPRAIFTSATMAVGGSLDTFCDNLGASVVDNRIMLPSPFPLATMGVTVVPSGPNPKSPDWPAWAVNKVVEAVREAKGRTLVLASSITQVNAYAAALAKLPYPMKKQGDSGRSELMSWFTNCTDGVLVGSKSFFTGVDVPGESLSCVIIDRIPFAAPGDPLEETIGENLSSKYGKSPYIAHDLPSAMFVLAQGAGRLIRADTDRGALVVLDNRVLSGGIVGQFGKNSLPPFPITESIKDVGAVIDGRPIGSVKPVVIKPIDTSSVEEEEMVIVRRKK